MDFYSYNKIDEFNSDFKIIFGSRGTGKSYGIKKKVIDKFFNSEENEQFVIVRRFEADIKQKIAQTYFADMADYLAETYHSKIKYYQGQFWIKDINEPDSGIKGARPCGYMMALNLTERYKSTSYPDVTTIVFEEFMSMNNRYLSDEISLFNNFVSTIVRKRKNVSVYMLANAISRYNPYTNELGIDLSKIEVDSIVTLQKYDGEERYKYVIERTKNVKVENNADYYYQFQDSSKKGNMVTDGDFETKAYPLERKGITTDDLELFRQDTLIYIKYGLDYFILEKGQATKQIVNPLWLEWKEEQEYDDDYITFSNVDLNEPEPPKYTEQIVERIYGWEQTEEPTDDIKQAFTVVILNTVEDVKDVKTYASMPNDWKWLREQINMIVDYSVQNWLIFDSHFTGDSVNQALLQLMS